MVWKPKKSVEPIKKEEEAEVLDEDSEVEEESEEEQEEEAETEEEPKTSPPVTDEKQKQITLNEVLLNHEERLKNIESALFRLKNI